MIKYIIKKYIMRKVNTLLDSYEDDATKVRCTLHLWCTRLENVIKVLKSFISKLDDNKLDCDEVDQTISEVEEAI